MVYGIRIPDGIRLMHVKVVTALFTGVDSHIALYDFQIQLSNEQKARSSSIAFNITQDAIDSTVVYLNNLLALPDGQNDMNAEVGLVDGVLQYSSPAIQAFWQSGSLDSMFENIAVDMSAAVRNAGNDSSLLTSPIRPSDYTGSVNSGQPVLPEAVTTPLVGYSQRYIVTIHVRWAFLIAPMLVCVLSAVFLAGVALQTRRIGTPLWKESEMPSLVWGLDVNARVDARHHWHGRGIKGENAFEVEFRRTKAGGELVRAI
ncbi:MAG: hypothetical protein Q9160_005074 [Pyrenula sp. 1 TL-2023]